jgi:hypothetical protein
MLTTAASSRRQTMQRRPQRFCGVRNGRFSIAAAASIIAASVFSASCFGSSKTDVVRTGNLSVRLPEKWTSAKEFGGYRNCTRPVVKLWAASYRLPAWFGRHQQGPLVVPPGQVLIVFAGLPVKSGSTRWKRWRVSNAKLRPAVPVGGSRYRAQLSFPSTPAVNATMWTGDRRLSRGMLRSTNRVLASLSVDPGYRC